MRTYPILFILGLPFIITTSCSHTQSQRNLAADKRLKVEVIAKGLARPWSLNFAPDGRLFFTNRDSGEISVMDANRAKVDTLAKIADVRVEGEAGLLGMELDPDFLKNGIAYVCYSSKKKDDPINRVARLKYKDGKFTQEKTLLETLGGILHNGCRVVTKDGYLFISMGENFDQSRAQDPAKLAGKILRIRTDGTVPADNPFPGSPVWTLGHRNPQGLAFEPSTGNFWSTEHGPDTNDELNLIKKGRNYGWPKCTGESRCFNKELEPAVKSYYPQETVAISDLMFYTGNAFPEWKGNIFFVTLKTARLYRVVLDGERVKDDEILIDGDYGRLRDVAQGPDGMIYIATESGLLRVTPAH